MKLLDILQELEKPKQIYATKEPEQPKQAPTTRQSGKEITLADLTPEEYKKLKYSNKLDWKLLSGNKGLFVAV